MTSDFSAQATAITDDADNYIDVEPDFDPPVNQAGTGDTGKVVLATAGAALGVLVPPAAVPIAAGVAALEVWREKLYKQQEQRVETVLQSASEQSDLGPEEVVKRIIEDDDLTLLMAEAVDAARRSRLSSKAAALGRSLGEILKDDALLDREAIWVRILSVIEPPHLRVMKHYVKGAKLGNGSTYWKPGVAVSVRTVSEHLRIEGAVLPLVQDLLRCGFLMRPGGIDGGTAESVYTPDSLNEDLRSTWLGAELFQRLDLAAEEA